MRPDESMIQDARSTLELSVVGLGKLGLPFTGLLAERGYRVHGVDVSENVIRRVADSESTFDEPGLARLIRTVRSRLDLTTDLESAARSSDALFVVVPTPSDERGAFSVEAAVSAATRIGAGLRHNPRAYPVVVMTSTVMPGATGGRIREVLERTSGRIVGRSLGLCYNPEFVALGEVIAGMRRPRFVLIGESDGRAGDVVEKIHRTLCENDPPVHRMALVNAEVAKIAVNTFVTTKISFANLLAAICERLPGGDVDVVTAAIGEDDRIGPSYLKGALGYGGPCFPRDNLALATLARDLGVPPRIPLATDLTNGDQCDRLVELARRLRPNGRPIAVLGLAYKPNTSVTERSPGLEIACRLASVGEEVLAYDPMIRDSLDLPPGSRIQLATVPDDCVSRAGLVIIATGWCEFRDLPVTSFERSGDRVIVIDCWRLLPTARFGAIVDLVYPGRFFEPDGDPQHALTPSHVSSPFHDSGTSRVRA